MRHTLLATALVVATGCGGGGDAGGGGGDPAPVAAQVTVTAAGASPLASVGDTRALSAVVKDAGGTTIPNATVTWSASPAGVVTIDPVAGLAITATAAGNGTATITATSGPASGTASVPVAQVLDAIAVSPSPVAVAPGTTRQLAVTANDARAHAIGGASGFTFASANPAVATVSDAGVVTGVANGTTTVTVSLTRDGVAKSAQVNVVVSPFAATAGVTATAGNAFSPATVDIAAGGTVTWTFQASHNVTFTSGGSPGDIDTRATGTASLVFPTAGTFAYTCTLHAGMNGQVVVH